MAEFYDALPIDFIEPGETTTVMVDGFPVAVANVDGEYFAFQNLCPHQGSKLGGRSLDQGCFIVCPTHASRYDVRSGACVRPSNSDGFNQDLMVFPVRIQDDVVQIQI
ncbi:Rieske (2Fe-2S) protein [Pseudofrankia inefficax]|uniref:Rieske (2Fe-2S) iron-sulfur domain protein n=1 Tax=Pseudofrankia inefficax (strain DSM 45817 / CECT 9037 / DDB 130130 / EuI1c) TaxID=298654 RepID=E3J883_PSEI1|nr:Rieske (2Fe-2S) protein [Pseudofrankia inefficax]ADP83276.1 Rieske (2Fe-2S) iron-sulfur domain protein [Pseudofrankia inefficax]